MAVFLMFYFCLKKYLEGHGQGLSSQKSLPIRLQHNLSAYLPRLVRGIQGVRSVAGSLDPANKSQDVGIGF